MVAQTATASAITVMAVGQIGYFDRPALKIGRRSDEFPASRRYKTPDKETQ
jgi:hypothetical protein